MSTPEQTYKKLSDAVEAIRIGHKAARKRVDETGKLSASKRVAGRDEYIRELLELQAAGQAVLDTTTDFDQREMYATQFGARSPNRS